MKHRIQKHLIDVQMASANIAEFLKEKTRNDYLNDLLLRSAVERQFEIIGEALNRAAREKEDLELDILDLWKIIGLRNRIIHGYDAVDDEALWDISQEQLPRLQKCLIELLR